MTHDGFYLQLTAGCSYLSLSAPAGWTDPAHAGLALSTSFMIGGTPMPGLAVGGGFFVDYGPSPTAPPNGNDAETNISAQYLTGVGVFGDYYPDPADGWHVQGLVGLGAWVGTFDGDVAAVNVIGVALSVAGGYDVWIDDDWSVGAMLRLAYAPLFVSPGQDSPGAIFTGVAPAVLINVTYH